MEERNPQDASTIAGVPKEQWLGLMQDRIRIYAAFLTRRHAFRYESRDELFQELFVRIYPLLARYDATRSAPATFIDRMTRFEAGHLLRSRLRAIRRHQKFIDASQADPKTAFLDEGGLKLDQAARALTGAGRDLLPFLLVVTPSQMAREGGFHPAMVHRHASMVRDILSEHGFAPHHFAPWRPPLG